MDATLERPAGYGFEDVGEPTVRASPGEGGRWFPHLRIYYPAERGQGTRLSPLGGSWPTVLFVPGMPQPTRATSPRPDFARWDGLLQLLARTGTVVASVDMTGVPPDDVVAHAAARVTIAQRYMREQWGRRQILARAGGIGVAGYGRGAAACAYTVATGSSVQAVASIAGVWSALAAEQLSTARMPTLLIAGTGDSRSASPAAQPYASLGPPKHAAAVQAAGGRDWVGAGSPAPDRCHAAGRIAGELLAVFFHRYLNDRTDLPPSLLTARRRWWPPRTWTPDTAGRPALPVTAPCALMLRWQVSGPIVWQPPVEPAGSATVGPWSAEPPAGW